MNKPFDAWGKALWQQDSLEELQVAREVQLAGESLSLDLQLNPRGALTPKARQLLGEAARIAAQPACIELYSTRPRLRDLRRSLRKHFMVQERDPLTTLWLIFSEPSAALQQHLQATPLPGAPDGFYDVGGLGRQHLIVVPELPINPETLFLRLLGRDDTLRLALLEALALGVQNPLGQAVSARLSTFLSSFQSYGLLPQTPQEVPMLTPDVIKAFEARTAREHEAIRQHGFVAGEQLMLSTLCARWLGRALTEPELNGLTQRLQHEGVEAVADAVASMNIADLPAWLLGES